MSSVAIHAGGRATRFGGRGKGALGGAPGYHPLRAANTRACVELIARRIAAGRLKMTDLLDAVRVRVVTVAEMRAFGDPDTLVANVNTPGEYLGLEALQGHEL